MKLAGVVVLYNPDDNVVNNIDSYIGFLDILYVVDNSTINNLKKYKGKKIKYIFNGKNLGIAEALNIGARHAIKDGYKWMLTMDQDSCFDDESIDKMANFLLGIRDEEIVQNILDVTLEKVGLISPFHITSIEQNTNCRGIDSPMNVMTSGNLINLDAYLEIGGFKDWFFIDSVDFDYCLNLRKHHYQIYRLNYVKLTHNLGNPVFKKFLFKNMYSLNHSAVRRYYIVRNRYYLNDLYKKDFPEYCKLEMSRTKKEAIKIVLCEKEKIKKLKAMFQGYLDYKRGIKGEKRN